MNNLNQNTAHVTQHNAECACGMRKSIMTGEAAWNCTGCGTRYQLPEQVYGLDAIITGQPADAPAAVESGEMDTPAKIANIAAPITGLPVIGLMTLATSVARDLGYAVPPCGQAPDFVISVKDANYILDAMLAAWGK